ncbi:MAG: HAD-IC family P-type ATPase, partial [Methylocella sp.]
VLNGLVWAPSLAALVAQSSIKLTNIVTEDTFQKIIDIFRQAPKFAWVVVDGAEIQLPLDQVHIGQTVIINAGEVVPVDGKVSEGMALMDERLLTGESLPVEKSRGDAVFAGTVLLSGRVEVVVEKAGEQTTIAQIGQILNATIEYKSTSQLRAESLAERTVLPTLVAGAVAVPLLGPMGALAVVDAHFRQRLSFLSPLALMNYLSIAARQGILIKDGRSLDLLHRVDTLVFDKTGTLTEEQPSVVRIYTFADTDEQQILRYAAAAEQKQNHPIARAILAAAQQRQLTIPVLEAAEYKVGYGLTVKVENRQVEVGSRRFIEAAGCALPPALQAIQEQAQGHSLVLVACDGVLAGAIELLPTVRPEAKRMIRELRERYGITATYIISGDQEAPTRKLAQELEIDHYFAETLPEQKADLI